MTAVKQKSFDGIKCDPLGAPSLIESIIGDGNEQKRDALLLKLLHTPHQPRPKREREKGKPAKCVSTGKSLNERGDTKSE
jgi:hypothetical protein